MLGELIHDKENKKITYKNATLDVNNIPILYTPYFSHPDPQCKKRGWFFGTIILIIKLLILAQQLKFLIFIQFHNQLILQLVLFITLNKILCCWENIEKNLKMEICQLKLASLRVIKK